MAPGRLRPPPLCSHWDRTVNAPQPTIRAVRRELRAAEDYQSWQRAARRLDELTGMQQWRAREQTNLYDHRAIRARLDRFRRLRQAGDYPALLYSLSEGVHGNIDGIGHPKLYQKARFGTKLLIENYIDEICTCLETLAALDPEKLDPESVRDLLQRTRHSFGRPALMLSGGGILGNFHMGVVKTLWEQDLLPQVISGASAGAIVAAIVGTHTREELRHRLDNRHLMRAARDEASWLGRMGSVNAQMQQRDLRQFIDELIPDLTFHEARALTGYSINVSVSPAQLHQNSRLLNAVTSPHVLVRSAVLASAAVPGVFPPVRLEARNDRGERQPYLQDRKWIDGSVTEDLPARRLSRLYGINHFIVSQTNPVVLPFLDSPLRLGRTGELLRTTATNIGREALRLSRDLGTPYAQRWPRAAMHANSFYAVALQNYRGDINILPDYRLVNPLRLLAVPSEAEIIALERAGERSTWPQLEAIRLTTRISRTVERLLANDNPLPTHRLTGSSQA